MQQARFRRSTSPLRTTLQLALLLSAALTACVPRVEEPEVRLTSVQVAALGFQGGLLHAEFEVINPNRFSISASRVDYEIEFSKPGTDSQEWAPLASGMIDEEVRVDARDTAAIEVPISFRYSRLGGALRSILETGTLEYRVRGTIEVDEPLRTSVPYRHQSIVNVTGR